MNLPSIWHGSTLFAIHTSISKYKLQSWHLVFRQRYFLYVHIAVTLSLIHYQQGNSGSKLHPSNELILKGAALCIIHGAPKSSNHYFIFRRKCIYLLRNICNPCSIPAINHFHPITSQKTFYNQSNYSSCRFGFLGGCLL